MNGIKSFDKLAKYGPTGVNIALVMAIIFIIWFMMNFLGNHLSDTTEVIRKNTEVTQELQGAFRELHGAFKELKTFLMLKNGRNK